MLGAQPDHRSRGGRASSSDLEIAAKLNQGTTSRNALKLSPRQRARVCEAIRRELDLEHVHRTNARREILARLAIGLPPYQRNFYWEHC